MKKLDVASGQITEDYVHGYATTEQERLLRQAEHWRDELMLAGTTLYPGTRLLEVGCGVGAVLGILGVAFPGIILAGVDIEARQLEAARAHLTRLGLEADLRQADALELPFPDASFDHVWMMWFLEHLPDPVAALREARRVLVPGGAVTAIEVDYSTCHANPSTAALDALLRAMVRAMAAVGRSDAGTRLPGWLHEADFDQIEAGERPFLFRDEDLADESRYAAEVIDSALPALTRLLGASEEELRACLADLRDLPNVP